MKVMLVHNSYQQSGGEDTVLASEMNLLLRCGNEVNLFHLHNNTVNSVLKKIHTALHAPYSRAILHDLRARITLYNPDVVHVHNIFPLITPSVFDACRDMKVPVVYTLHNFRTVCPGALLLRDGRICEKCLHGTAYRAALYGCYRNSRIGSLAVARLVEYHRKRNTWRDKVDLFIALTQFAKRKFVEAGFSDKKIVVKPNFVAAPAPPDIIKERNGALFVGRLSPEKGLRTILDAWEKLEVPLQIAGKGPLLDEIVNRQNDRICVRGHVSGNEISDLMFSAYVLIMASDCYEGFPMGLVEAFSHGLPVIAPRLGSMEELIQDHVTGLLYEPGNAEDLAAKVKWAVYHREELMRMGRNARKVYQDKYTPETNYSLLIEIYKQAMLAKHDV
jgi:glycosyltransferase involved in cell wall biosynthesis